ncbi:MAG: DoxX family protein [Parcubacteria group bacterium GW2011_GWF2_38_8]|nr:MAG: DoxX family protein [Parcubacteria group bacterium GW2011_GWF2_38_8]
MGYVLGLLRLVMGWIFLWAFLDKLLGLGFATLPDKAWLAGGSPTSGFLQFGVHGPFASFYQSLAGSALVDWLFMLGLLFIGVSLMFGIFMRLGGSVGILILFLMYTAVGLSPANNLFIDEHIIYILVLIMLVLTDAGQYLGIGNRWGNTSLVGKYRFLK